MLHKLSSRNAPEARRWRLAHENLDEAYVHRTLSPDFLSKSSDSGFWSKRQRFRPKVYATLGYILAGFFLSPEFPWTMKIIDGAGIQAWADIGVVILLFALGLELGLSNIVVKLDSYLLQAIRINETSPFRFNSIRDSGIRELCHRLVVGVERKGRRILNPDSLLKIEPNDLLWIVGDQDLLRSL